MQLAWCLENAIQHLLCLRIPFLGILKYFADEVHWVLDPPGGGGSTWWSPRAGLEMLSWGVPGWVCPGLCCFFGIHFLDLRSLLLEVSGRGRPGSQGLSPGLRDIDLGLRRCPAVVPRCMGLGLRIFWSELGDVGPRGLRGMFAILGLARPRLRARSFGLWDTCPRFVHEKLLVLGPFGPGPRLKSPGSVVFAPGSICSSRSAIKIALTT